MKDLEPKIGSRIAVFGTSGSGKTTLCRELAGITSYEHIELDSIYHLPNWQARPDDDFRAEVAKRIDGDRWITDGNYGVIRNLLLERADTLIWLDYPLMVSLSRVTRRSIWRGMLRAELWNGNRESLRKTLFTKDSMIWWTLTTSKARAQRLSALFADSLTDRHIKHRLRSPRQTKEFVKSLRQS